MSLIDALFVDSVGAKVILVRHTTGKETFMPSVFDLAAFILGERGEMTAMKLQKLVYYSQAWSLVWDDEPIFNDSIQAWANGPVVSELYNWHRGEFKVKDCPAGNANAFTANQQDTVRKVLEFYGEMPSQVLSDLTHSETPWMSARNGLGPGERGNRVISNAAMAEYYSSLSTSR
jgi:uncharacterized phage-associated protein